MYTSVLLNSKEHKQIFTPYHICHMMAEITFGDLVTQVEEKVRKSVADFKISGHTEKGKLDVTHHSNEVVDVLATDQNMILERSGNFSLNSSPTLCWLLRKTQSKIFSVIFTPNLDHSRLSDYLLRLRLLNGRLNVRLHDF